MRRRITDFARMAFVLRRPFSGSVRSLSSFSRLGLLALMMLASCQKSSERRKQERAHPSEESLERVALEVPEVAKPAPDPCERAPGLLMLDDFEDGDNTALSLQGGSGGWVLTTDGTKDATVHPAVGPANPTRLQPPYCDSNFALHLSGQGFLTWGAQVSIGPRFADNKVQPVNLAEYRGIRFRVRAGDTHLGVLKIRVDDVNTHEDGGVCTKGADMGSAGGCWNSFAADLPVIGGDWEERSFEFEALAQGVPDAPPRKLDRSRLYSVGFRLSPGNPFDIWIDDVSFFK